jgi:hypothetical protein
MMDWRKEVLMRKLLALLLPAVLTMLIPSTASAHHRHYDTLHVDWDGVGCHLFYDDIPGPVTDVTFEGSIEATEHRADVWAIRSTWRLYDSETGKLLRESEMLRRLESTVRFGVDWHVPPDGSQYLMATMQWKRMGQPDIFHTREVARYPSEECF